jgi:hypothetical protein
MAKSTISAGKANRTAGPQPDGWTAAVKSVAEGLNDFTVMDLGAVTATELGCSTWR